MAYQKMSRRKYVICIWVGLQLMSFALFLHPMSPEDFLMLAITAPLDTITDQNGSAMAFGFWISLSLVWIGLFGWIDIVHLFKNLRRTKAHRSLSHTR